MNSPDPPPPGDIAPLASGPTLDPSSSVTTTGSSDDENTSTPRAEEMPHSRGIYATDAAAPSSPQIEREQRYNAAHEDIISQIRHLLDSARGDHHHSVSSGPMPPATAASASADRDRPSTAATTSQAVPISSSTAPAPASNASVSPFGVRARRSGIHGVDLRVHWADQEDDGAAETEPPNPTPAEGPAHSSAQSANMNMSMNTPAAHLQRGAPFPVTPVQLMMTHPVIMNPAPVVYVSPGLAPPAPHCFQAPAMGTSSWYRESPFYTGTAHWRTHPPVIVNTTPNSVPVFLGQPSYVVMYR